MNELNRVAKERLHVIHERLLRIRKRRLRPLLLKHRSRGHKTLTEKQFALIRDTPLLPVFNGRPHIRAHTLNEQHSGIQHHLRPIVRH